MKLQQSPNTQNIYRISSLKCRMHIKKLGLENDLFMQIFRSDGYTVQKLIDLGNDFFSIFCLLIQ